MFDHDLITEELVTERYEASVDPAFREQAPEGRPGSIAVVEPLWKDLGQIKARTLVLWGRDNRVQGFDNAIFMLNQIPEVEVHIYGKTGLWIPWERPAGFIRQVVGFLTAD